jgi:hypothetical protein
MAAVQRYAQALVEDARRAGQSRLDKATELAELVRLADAGSADRLLQAIHTVNEAAMRTAERQAQGVLETAQTRLTLASKISETLADSAAKPPETAAEPTTVEAAPQGSRWPPVPPAPAMSEPAAEPAAAQATATDSEPGAAAVDSTDGQPPSTPSSTQLPANGVPAQAEPGLDETVRFRREET